MQIIGKTVNGRIVAIVTTVALGAGILGGAAVNAASVSGDVPSASDAGTAHRNLAEILAPLVTKGVITQAQADAVVQALEAARPQRPAGPPPGAGAFGLPRGGFAGADTYLGLSTEQIRTQLQAGRSLGEIADATAGKSRSGLIDALMKAGNARIDAAVASGRLGAEQATSAKARVSASVTKLVDHKGTVGPLGPRGDRGPFGHHGPNPSAKPATN